MRPPDRQDRIRVGLEHEYVVKRHGGAVDFRSVVHSLDVPGRRIDPGDPHAYRLDSGIAVTCDGREAEVATPPVPVRPGFIQGLRSWAGLAGRTLSSIVEPELEIEGGSTHLSVSVPNEVGHATAGMFCRTFAPAVMLLMDGGDSPGLLIRPRFDRVELGGDYVAGESLDAAVAMAVGGVIVCRDVASGRRRKRTLPPPIRVNVVASVLRYGWYVDRCAFGTDLYVEGRSARLRREVAGGISGQRMLAASWRKARRALLPLVAEPDLSATDAVVRGDRPLPSETVTNRAVETSALGPVSSPLGLGVRPLRRPGFDVEAVLATWDFTVFRAHGTRSIFLAVPQPDLGDFADQLTAGRLDGAIAQRIATLGRGVRLTSYDQALRPGVFDALDASNALAPPERGPDGVFRTARL